MASLGASLGVDVGSLLAADQQNYLNTPQNLGKGNVNQHKEGPAVELKWNNPAGIQAKDRAVDQLKIKNPDVLQQKEILANELKIKNVQADQLKFRQDGDSLLLKNGDSLVRMGGKTYVRTKAGKQTLASDGAYELQNGAKIGLKNGALSKTNTSMFFPGGQQDLFRKDR